MINTSFIQAFKSDTSWLGRVQEYFQVDDALLANIIACFFADRPRTGLPVRLPEWADELKGAALLEKQAEVIKQHGFDTDMSILGVMHLEYIIREDYRDEDYEQFFNTLETLMHKTPEPHILDFGSGMSGFGQLALAAYPVTCTFADVDPETLNYLQCICDSKWPGRAETQALPVLGNPVAKRHRVRINPQAVTGAFDVIIAADVLEHMLDPLTALIHLYDSLNRPGFFYVVYPDTIEGDWHTPEAHFLRPRCLSFLTRTCLHQSIPVWVKGGSSGQSLKHLLRGVVKRTVRAPLTRIEYKIAAPYWVRKSRRFARKYFTEHGDELLDTVRNKAKRVVRLEELLASID
ncbi:methyltransferase domain-containing protein [Fibrobacterota bacterium]